MTIEEFNNLLDQRIMNPKVGDDIDLITKSNPTTISRLSNGRIEFIEGTKVLISYKGTSVLLNFDDDWIEYKIGRKNIYMTIMVCTQKK